MNHGTNNWTPTLDFWKPSRDWYQGTTYVYPYKMFMNRELIFDKPIMIGTHAGSFDTGIYVYPWEVNGEVDDEVNGEEP